MAKPGRNVLVVHRCGLVELTLERSRQLLRVVRVDVQAFAHTRAGDVGESLVHKGGRLAALGVNDDLVSSCTLGRMARNCIPVIDVRRFARRNDSGPA